MTYELYYFDKSGRRYEGKERICPTCSKQEIVRASNNSLQCQECARPKPNSEVDYFDLAGRKYAGKIKICSKCTNKTVVRISINSSLCKKCSAKNRKSSIKEGEKHFFKKNGTKIRAYSHVCNRCGKERLIRNDQQIKTGLCKQCRAKTYFTELGKIYGPKSFKTGRSCYRQKVLSLYKNECSLCKNLGETGLDIHHVDLNRENNHFQNLMILCKSCHRSIHNQLRKGLSHEKALQTVKSKKTAPSTTPN